MHFEGVSGAVLHTSVFRNVALKLVTFVQHCSWMKVCISVAAEKDLVGAGLVSVLHKLLSDERSAPEIKYNSMILICAVMGSGETVTTHMFELYVTADWLQRSKVLC